MDDACVNCCRFSVTHNSFAMGDFQIKKQPKKYDAVIAGSGVRAAEWQHIFWPTRGLKVCHYRSGTLHDDPVKTSLNLRNHGFAPPRSQRRARPFGDFDASYGGWEPGRRTLYKCGWHQSGIGGDRECLEDALITGGGFHCALAPRILKERVSMGLVTIGL